MGKPKRKFILGSLYYISFLDHCLHGDINGMPTEVAGFVVEESDDNIVVSFWEPITKDMEILKENRELMTIIKSTIKRKRKVKRFEGESNG